MITRYGNYRTYQIEEVLTKESPRTKFYYDKEGKEISFQEYYTVCYNITVTNTRQPLIKVVSRIKKEIKKGEVLHTPEYIKLIPELLSLTGMTD